VCIAALLLMLHTIPLSAADISDYLYRQFAEDIWACTATDKIENTCNMPDLRKINFKRKKKHG